MTLRGKIHHNIRMLLLKKFINSITVCNALFHETEIRIFHHRFKCGQIARIGQTIQADNPVIRIFI